MINPYKSDGKESYTLGAFTTLELLQAHPEIVRQIYLHSRFADKAGVESLCRDLGIPVLELERNRPHLVLVNPGDRGNLGTIMRIAAGFRIRSLGIVLPAADPFHPKTVRASMGARFRIRCELFPSFEHYRSKYSRHRLYPFLLHADQALTYETCPNERLFSLVFGNEAAGLEESYFSQLGVGLRIPQSDLVDSLNLSVAAGIAAYDA